MLWQSTYLYRQKYVSLAHAPGANTHHEKRSVCTCIQYKIAKQYELVHSREAHRLGGERPPLWIGTQVDLQKAEHGTEPCSATMAA